jgi:Glycosyltransferase
MKCIYLGNPVHTEFIRETVDINFSVADNIAQLNFIEGLSKMYGEDLSVLSLASNFDNPKKKKTILHKQQIKLESGITACCIGYINFPIFYIATIILNYTIELLKLCFGNRKEPIVVLTYGPYMLWSFPVMIARLFFKICYVPFLVASVEHPDYTGLNRIASKMSVPVMKRIDGSITYVAQSSIDYSDKPYLTIFYSTSEEVIKLAEEYQRKDKNKKNEKFTILYSGALTKIKGADTLISVIKETKEEFQWIICGTGEYEKEVEELAKGNKGVEYLGNVTQREVIELQCSADMLVAFQSVDTEIYRYYAKYAATGKLIEYLLSGTPVVAPDIQATNEELKRYMNMLENQETKYVCEVIRECAEEERYKEIKKKAMEGRAFVLANANNDFQNIRITDFINMLYKDKYMTKS